MTVDMIHGQTFHGRKGAVQNSFRYTVDYIALDVEAPADGPSLFGRNRRNLTALWDTDHGGLPGQGRGSAWVREVLATHNLPTPARIILMAQPRILGHVFNPVSFWLCYDAAGDLRTVIAEVSNTYGDRHSYLAHHDNHGPITREDTLSARKIFYVSPFQPIEGGYAFRFDITDDRIGIWIDYTTPGGGLFTNLTGARVPLTNTGILRACLRRPFGSRRVLALIHWQALKLAIKGAKFRSHPKPPAEDVTR
ncbi:MAG: DUF1365 domain-containing protein [Pseudotabrizicola sp.]|uniref:DUF1365 domain-containing protein n=1 Tax=Pseudotabrizicola sp. TaxID=2939647 RepID=UPI0027313B5F|nr:DUF1365 domain-containing protein [Pseudotabrizicola sp.]MDP2082422.1 DUF1365 domain-containing protein [Pseudotabrizicola sp.]MDZ7574175.1 DUF1365 domain-containing protein [Pseudotabrizicola sp.]